MKTIERIICISGGLENLEEQSLHVYKPPFLPLHIRILGLGPRELPHICVSQMIPNGKTEGLESEITFEIASFTSDVWQWNPVSFRQALPPFYHECVWVEPEGHRGFDSQIERGLHVIANTWDEILVARGYMELGPVL